IGFSSMSWPPTVMVPTEGGMKPVIIRMEVDFPAPFGPRKPRTSPRSTENETLLTASFGPNALVRFWTLIILLLVVLPPAQSEVWQLTCHGNTPNMGYFDKQNAR